MVRAIYINGRFLSQPITGVQRYAIELIRQLDTLLGLNEIKLPLPVILLVPPNGRQIELKSITVRNVGLTTGHMWEQIELPIHSWDGLLINLCNLGPIFKLNQIVNIHDASVFACPKAYRWHFRLWYRIILTYLGIVSKQIITVSRFSQSELSKYLNISAKKIRVVYHGREHFETVQADDSILGKYNLTCKRFCLAVSSRNLNKNFTGLAEAWSFLNGEDIWLVLVGASNCRIFQENANIQQSRVITAGYITDEELKALYLHATCFIFPSFYEGFGLPPLEAMSAGCPIVVADIPVMREICGDAALYADPRSSSDIASKVLQVVRDKNLQIHLQGAVHDRSQQYSWRKCALETAKIIQEVLPIESSDSA